MSQPAHHDSGSGSILKILGIGCAGVTVIAVGVAIYVGLHLREWAGDGARAVLVAGIEESRLSDPQKVALTQRADRITEDFKAELMLVLGLGGSSSEMMRRTSSYAALLMRSFSKGVVPVMSS